MGSSLEMAMVAINVQEVVDRHIAAFNAKDVADYMADYAPNAMVVVGSRELSGTQPIRDHFARAFVLDPALKLEVFDRQINNEGISVRWVSKKGRRIAARGMEFYQFDEMGRIVLQRAMRDTK